MTSKVMRPGKRAGRGKGMNEAENASFPRRMGRGKGRIPLEDRRSAEREAETCR
jgi:hypothetical protein